MTVYADLLPVRVPDGALTKWQPSRVRLVEDPTLGTVTVRWRFPVGKGVRWRCGGCGIHSSDAHACSHIFAAALDLAEELLGLVGVGVVPPDPPERAAA